MKSADGGSGSGSGGPRNGSRSMNAGKTAAGSTPSSPPRLLLFAENLRDPSPRRPPAEPSPGPGSGTRPGGHRTWGGGSGSRAACTGCARPSAGGASADGSSRGGGPGEKLGGPRRVEVEHLRPHELPPANLVEPE